MTRVALASVSLGFIVAWTCSACEPTQYGAEGETASSPSAPPPQSDRNTVLLGEAGKEVFVLTSPPPGCDVLGDVFGQFASDDPGQAALGAPIQLRNNTAALGANAVVLQTNNASQDARYIPFGNVIAPGKHQVVLGGVAYRCPPRKPAPGMTSPPVPSESL